MIKIMANIAVLIYMLTLFSLFFSVSKPLNAQVEFEFSVRIAPPAIPVYELPPLPDEGYIWTPGYWAWDPDFYEYFWVPGSWVLAPEPDLWWTPGYWEWRLGFYVWNRGYWGTRVGYYGGINYGWGYFGDGYHGGYWKKGRFHNRKITHNHWGQHYSFFGPGGSSMRPSKDERSRGIQKRIVQTDEQLRLERLASARPDMRHSMNNGKPTIPAVRNTDEFLNAPINPKRSKPHEEKRRTPDSRPDTWGGSEMKDLRSEKLPDRIPQRSHGPAITQPRIQLPKNDERKNDQHRTVRLPVAPQRDLRGPVFQDSPRGNHASEGERKATPNQMAPLSTAPSGHGSGRAAKRSFDKPHGSKQH